MKHAKATKHENLRSRKGWLSTGKAIGFGLTTLRADEHFSSDTSSGWEAFPGIPMKNEHAKPNK